MSTNNNNTVVQHPAAANAMREVITELAERYGLDLNQFGASVQLEMDGYLPLVIERVGPYTLSVAHYCESGGDALADPEITFFIRQSIRQDDHNWYPATLTNLFSGYRRYLRYDNGGQVVELDYPGQLDLVDFSQVWARNIRLQGWLQRATKL